jgi:hypothetical protein
MYVYLPGKKNHSVFVTPANDPRGTELDGASQWKSEEGVPLQYNIRFTDGRASVDAQLGNWLIRHGYAQRTPLILPKLLRA